MLLVHTKTKDLYENYFTDIDALDDGKIAEMNKYNRETKELIKYFYLDIPMDTNLALEYFYEDMDSIFRDDFGTGSKTTEMIFEGLKSLFSVKE